MKKRTNRKAATGANGAAKERTNTAKPTPCPCHKQGTFPPSFGFTPPPEPGEGPVELYLRTRPGWQDRLSVSLALSLTEREVRLQAENSGGLVIFGSGRGQGLRHSDHADTWELRSCRAELIQRAQSHLRRADEIQAIIQEREAGR